MASQDCPPPSSCCPEEEPLPVLVDKEPAGCIRLGDTGDGAFEGTQFIVCVFDPVTGDIINTYTVDPDGTIDSGRPVFTCSETLDAPADKEKVGCLKVGDVADGEPDGSQFVICVKDEDGNITSTYTIDFPGGAIDSGRPTFFCENEYPVHLVDYVCNADTGLYDQIVLTSEQGILGDPVITPTTISCGATTVAADIEYVCNADTGFFDVVTTTIIDGVPEEPTIAPTEISCDEEVFDYEQPVICRDGTLHVVLNQIAEDGTVTELDAADTAEDCDGAVIDHEFVCNVVTGLYDIVTITSTDGVVEDVAVTATDIACVAPVVNVDVEYVCNADTGLFDQVTTTSTDGIPADPVIEPTTINCDEEVFDYEQPVVCRDGKLQVILNQIAEDGTVVELDATDTGQSCDGITVDNEFVCNLATGLYDQIVITSTNGVPGAPVVVPTTISCVAPVVNVDIEYVCNADTGLFDQIEIIIVDGIAGTPVVTPTTISCDEEVFDYEQPVVCRDGTLHVLLNQIGEDGTVAELGAADTGQNCEDAVIDHEFVCNLATGVYDQITITTIGGITGDPVVTPTTIACLAPVVSVDVEYVCNANTGLFDQVTITTTNGVPGAPVVVPTAISCDQEVYDYEQPIVCRDGTRHLLLNQIAEDGTVVELDAIDTGEECPEIYETECGYVGVTCETAGRIKLIEVPNTPKDVLNADTPGGNSEWVPGSGTSTLPDGLWNQPSDANGPVEGGLLQTFRFRFFKLVLDCTPECNDGTVKVKFVVDLKNLGPFPGLGVNSSVMLTNAAGAVLDVATGGDGRLLNQPVGSTASNMVMANLTPAQIAAGVFLEIGVESRHDSKKLSRHKAWDVTIPTADFEWDMTDCEIEMAPAIAVAPCSIDAVADAVADALEGVCIDVNVKALPEELPSCDTALIDVCDAVARLDELGDPLPLEQGDVVAQFFVSVTTCGADQTIEYVQIAPDPDNPDETTLVEYLPVGEIVNCDTLAPFTTPPPACPEGAQFSPVNIGGGYYFILDNSFGLPDGPNPSVTGTPPGNHLGNGQNVEFTFRDSAGNPVHVWQQTKDPLFYNLVATFSDDCPDCFVEAVCANHTSRRRGCHPAHVANLAKYPAYDPPSFPTDPQNNLSNPDREEVWASAWMINCGPCIPEIASVEITKANTEAWVGVERAVKVYRHPDVLGYQAVTCDGTFYKDCDGNDIPAPGCCPEPWTAPVETALDCALVECEDPCSNGSTYIVGRPPASNAWSWGPYSGANLNEFQAALAAAGYNLIQKSERHQICPPFGEFGEDPNALLDNGIGDPAAVPVEANIDPDFTPKDLGCALRVELKDPAQVLPVGESTCGSGDEEDCSVTEATQSEHSGFSVFAQDGAPALKYAAFDEAMTSAITTAIENDCLFVLKHGDGATFVGNGETSVPGETGSGVLSPGLASATACDGSELDSVLGDQGNPSTLTLITYCGDSADIEPREVLFTEDQCLAAKVDRTNELLETLIGCLCGPCDDDPVGVELDRRCQAYAHPLTSGYKNWNDTDELDDLADEFGITPTTSEMWVRIIEFDCGGAAQPQVGQVFGPYTPGTNGADDFIDDLEAAIAGTCLAVSNSSVANTGPNGTTGLHYSYNSGIDATLVIQEGVTVGAGPSWFSSAQGFVVRNGVAGDFIQADGVGSTSNYAAQDSEPGGQYADAEECADL